MDARLTPEENVKNGDNLLSLITAKMGQLKKAPPKDTSKAPLVRRHTIAASAAKIPASLVLPSTVIIESKPVLVPQSPSTAPVVVAKVKPVLPPLPEQLKSALSLSQQLESEKSRADSAESKLKHNELLLKQQHIFLESMLSHVRSLEKRTNELSADRIQSDFVRVRSEYVRFLLKDKRFSYLYGATLNTLNENGFTADSVKLPFDQFKDGYFAGLLGDKNEFKKYDEALYKKVESKVIPIKQYLSSNGENSDLATVSDEDIICYEFHLQLLERMNNQKENSEVIKLSKHSLNKYFKECKNVIVHDVEMLFKEEIAEYQSRIKVDTLKLLSDKQKLKTKVMSLTLSIESKSDPILIIPVAPALTPAAGEPVVQEGLTSQVGLFKPVASAVTSVNESGVSSENRSLSRMTSGLMTGLTSMFRSGAKPK